jgi:Type ISP C-terminal specificity domain/N-6 DNA Methylase
MILVLGQRLGANRMNPLETYLRHLQDIRCSGAAVAETSFYPALSNLLNETGKLLKPKVYCVINISNRGAGLPDAGLFTADQIRKNDTNLMRGQLPARGVVEAKSPAEDVKKIAESEQVKRYSERYGVVLVTNYRDFLLVGKDSRNNPLPMEAYTLAENEAAFWQSAAHPQSIAKADAERFCEYLRRVLQSVAPLISPQDVAWFLASYARDAKARVENHRDLSELAAIRRALEEALGMEFTGEKGEHFFRSTLVQTIFYGVFSAWVLWHREFPGRKDPFDWRVSAYSLHVPFIRSLYEQIATPKKLGDMRLVEVLDWTAGALNRVDREAFFCKFQDKHAVQYFYEPFLKVFDPDLRKELGVWFTPPEIVQYQVARVDTVLRNELGLLDGLADPNVVVLDPCCGTGAYLLEVLKKIAETLKAKGGDALIASDLKKAAMTRIFGFEILPAPFVVSHLQLGLMLHGLGAPLSAKRAERVGVYLTNSLTGWEPPKKPKQTVLAFMEELQHEKDAAEKVKRSARVLVVLGNPPYNAFAGVSPNEEQGLVEAYKHGIKEWGITKNYLDDLYIRFFRLAERRIVEMNKPARGVVSYISNFSYLSDPSFVIMRQRFLSEFDGLWFDCMNGDSRKTGKLTPEGLPDPSVFSTEYSHEGIRVGTAICVIVRKTEHEKTSTVRFRNFWGVSKRQDLIETLSDKAFNSSYKLAKPCKENRYSFRPEKASLEYLSWPKITWLSATTPYLGLNENRGGGLQDSDKAILTARMRTYLDKELTWEQYKVREEALVKAAAGFVPESVRVKVQEYEPFSENRIRRYLRRPFDLAWAYISDVSPLWNRSRPDLRVQLSLNQPCIITRPSCPASPEGIPFFITKHEGEQDAIRGHAYLFPFVLAPLDKRKRAKGQGAFSAAELNMAPKANISLSASAYLKSLGFKNSTPELKAAETIWFHTLALGYTPVYLADNADGIRRDWPRIPMPNSRKGLEESAELGRQIGLLLDLEGNVPKITSGEINPLVRSIAVLTKVGAGNLDPDAGDLAVTSGWGHAGKAGITMPAKGRIIQRAYDEAEQKALYLAAEDRGLSRKTIFELLGPKTFDIFLNDHAYWKNIPFKVWEYYIGGYQVIKKWLSYRDKELLGRDLTAKEAREVTGIARRLTALILLQPALNSNYQSIISNLYRWPSPVGKAQEHD